jgi:cytochrome c556
MYSIEALRGFDVRRRIIIAGATLAMVVGIAQSTAASQINANKRQLEAIEQRQQAMKRIGGAMKTLVGFSKGEIQDHRQVIQAAAAIEHSGRRLRTLWPKGTGTGVAKSKARSEIWTESQQFSDHLQALIAAARATRRAAATGDRRAVDLQLKTLGGTCKSCHSRYQHSS